MVGSRRGGETGGKVGGKTVGMVEAGGELSAETVDEGGEG